MPSGGQSWANSVPRSSVNPCPARTGTWSCPPPTPGVVAELLVDPAGSALYTAPGNARSRRMCADAPSSTGANTARSGGPEKSGLRVAVHSVMPMREHSARTRATDIRAKES